ncbi:hypothetical protein PTE30175_00364 [Pandoraea terrae]|uniref:MASE1 domain-containing protein n=1 Tax=Pandoraea terrae TaxID=1537710 RepID=A0A5E4RSG1_9BURK|nr:hypothetical protein [Pandoraea terrae]VVD66370.1 hypothetical protein PTE30175_00364 [Pandoraea terrae]
MSPLRLHLCAIVGSTIAFVAATIASEWIFTHSEFVRGVNWVYLPAGMRLLCTLLFGEAGAIGVMAGSWLTCFFYFFPDDTVRAFIGGILSATAPYLVYRAAVRYYGLRTTLTNLTARKLMVLIVATSLASPLLHNAWFLLRGDTDHWLARLCIMIIGDLCGTLIVVYTMKGLLALLPRRAPPEGMPARPN